METLNNIVLPEEVVRKIVKCAGDGYFEKISLANHFLSVVVWGLSKRRITITEQEVNVKAF
jgi:hypothetical protein